MKQFIVVIALLMAIGSADAGIFTSKPLLSMVDEAVPLKSDGSANSLLDVQLAIEDACGDRNWACEIIGDGRIQATQTRSSYGAQVLVSFSSDLFSITYITSRNLDYNERRQSIHRTYNNWVATLSRDIKKKLGSTRPQYAIALNAYTANGVEDAPTTEAEVVNHHFSGRTLDRVEGIWTWSDNTYQVAIIRNTTGIESQYDYIGIIVRAELSAWQPGDVKLLLNSTASPSMYTGVYFDSRKSRNNLSYIMEDPNLIKVNETFPNGQPLLVRDYPADNGRGAAIGDNGVSLGTCFVVDTTGTIVTSNHVVASAREITVTLADGRKLPATVSVSSAATDIAVLETDASTPNYLTLAPTRSINSGEPVFTIGYPTVTILGSEAKFTEGSISALSGVRGEASYMQISVPIQPGNSGGPVVNMKGEVLGVVAATAAVEAFYNLTGALPQNVNWAIKSDYVKPMLSDVPSRPKATNRASAISEVQRAICKVAASN